DVHGRARSQDSEDRFLNKQHRISDSSSRPRRLSSETPNGELAPVDCDRIRAAVREILLAVGEDPDREGLVEQPDRGARMDDGVARMYAELSAGLRKDPRELLEKKFTQKYDEMVLERDIEFASICEHHLLPFLGKTHIGYIPNGKIVGLSKLARVVELLSRRP